MLLPTTDFAVFLVVVLTASWLLRPRERAWKVFLLAASAWFYLDPFGPGTAAGDHRNALGLAVLVALVAVTQGFALAVHRTEPGPTRHALVAGAVAVDVVVLAWFKGSGRFAPLGAYVAAPRELPAGGLPAVLVPVGLSFLVLGALSYVIDVARGDERPVALVDLAVHLLFFPHVLAGPVLRVGELVPQLRARADPRRVEAGAGFGLILRGLFKKVVVASYLATVTGPVLGDPGRYGRIAVVVAVAALSVQLFADISGYTDLATGVARLFGLRFPASFAAPYTARSLADFWHRWHLTVARWFRDYVYRPLGGDRRGGPRAAVNIAVTFLLAGLWHGANPTFVIWAAIHAAGLVAEGWWRSRRVGQPPLVSGAPGRALAGVATFTVVSGAWVFFGARDLGAALSVFGHLVVGGAGDPSPVTPLVVAVIAASLAAQFVPPAVPRRIVARVTATPPAVQAAVGAAALLVIRLLGPDGVARFVYERF